MIHLLLIIIFVTITLIMKRIIMNRRIIMIMAT